MFKARYRFFFAYQENLSDEIPGIMGNSTDVAGGFQQVCFCH